MCKPIKITKALNIASREIVVIDTNVLLWTFYSKIKPQKSYQTGVYPSFISGLISKGNEIIVTSFCLNEMFHVIEKTEFDLYKNSNSKKCNRNFNIKSYRKIQSERTKVKKEIELIYNQIKSIPNIKIVKSKANYKTLDRFIFNYETHLSDFFDFSLITFCNNHKYSIISDDQDINSPCIIYLG